MKGNRWENIKLTYGKVDGSRHVDTEIGGKVFLQVSRIIYANFVHYKLLREQFPSFRELTLPKKTWETKLKDKLLARSLKQLYMHKLKQQQST